MINHGRWIQTWDGQAFDLDNPTPEMIDTETIARVLSRIPRFGGHTKEFYSVAQHSYLVAQLVPAELKLAALLHDAHEAYSGFGDVCAPAKCMVDGLAPIERRIDRAVAKHFDFSPELFKDPLLKNADLVMLATEARDLLGPPPMAWGELPQALVVTLEVWDSQQAYAVLFNEIVMTKIEILNNRMRNEEKRIL